MKKATLKVVRNVRYPFYQAILESNEEQFIDDEYKIVWDEAEEAGLKFSLEDRLEILKLMNCIKHLKYEGVDYFFCRDLDEYWEELAIILDKKENE